jgi:hypothetical protein
MFSLSVEVPTRALRKPKRRLAARIIGIGLYAVGCALLTAGAVFVAYRLLIETASWSRLAVASLAFGAAVALALMTRLVGRWVSLSAVISPVFVGLLTAVAILAWGLPSAVLSGWIAGAVSSVPLIAVVILAMTLSPSAILDFEARVEESAAAARSSHRGRITLVIFLVSIVLAYAVSRQPPAPWWQAILGWAVGLAYIWHFGLNLAIRHRVRIMNIVFALTRDPVPWNPRFLDFAVAHGLLVKTNGEVRFIHILVRDHLAKCRPRALSAATLTRRREVG